MNGILDFRRLRYFLAIADCGSISAAARLLNVAQPALSYHMSEMERLLGQPLFDRSREGVRLTEAGGALRRYAREIIDKVDEAETALQGLTRKRKTTRRIRIAVISSLAADLVPILLETMARECPDVILRISEGGTREIEQKLERNETDLAVYLTSTHRPGEQPLATEQLYFLAPAAEGPENETITLREVVRNRLVLPASGNPLRSFVETAVRQNGLSLDIALEIDGWRSRQSAVLKGIGCTILGAHSVATENLEGLVAREIVSPRLFRPIYHGVRRDLDPELAASMTTVLKSALRALGLHAPRNG